MESDRARVRFICRIRLACRAGWPLRGRFDPANALTMRRILGGVALLTGARDEGRRGSVRDRAVSRSTVSTAGLHAGSDTYRNSASIWTRKRMLSSCCVVSAALYRRAARRMDYRPGAPALRLRDLPDAGTTAGS